MATESPNAVDSLTAPSPGADPAPRLVRSFASTVDSATDLPLSVGEALFDALAAGIVDVNQLATCTGPAGASADCPHWRRRGSERDGCVAGRRVTCGGLRRAPGGRPGAAGAGVVA